MMIPARLGRDPALSAVSLLPLIYVVFATGVALAKPRYQTRTPPSMPRTDF
jgi:hypothetical protein